MFRIFTKWIPLGAYTWAGNIDYIVFVRKNTRTGMMQFKTKRVQAWWANKASFFPGIIDTQKAWDEITSVLTNRGLTLPIVKNNVERLKSKPWEK